MQVANRLDHRHDAARQHAVGPARDSVPHLDGDVNREMTVGSSEHARLSNLLTQPGRLIMSGQVKLPRDRITIRCEAASHFQLTLGSETLNSKAASRGAQATEMTLNGAGDFARIVVELATGESTNPPAFQISFHTATDHYERPVPLAWLSLPWAPASAPKAAPSSSPPAELAGGDWDRGKAIFYGDKVQCSKCHTLRDTGGKVGPDLSNLIYKDVASVWRDIAEPSATINPDHVSYLITLKDAHIQRAVALANEVGDLPKKCWANLWLLVLIADRAGPNAAAPIITEVRKDAIRLGDAQILAALHLYAGQLDAKRGLLGTAAAHLRRCQEILYRGPNLWLDAQLHYTTANLAILRSDHKSALEHARKAVTLAEESGGARREWTLELFRRRRR
jgi:mono/diheme cytochrome c family protein